MFEASKTWIIAHYVHQWYCENCKTNINKRKSNVSAPRYINIYYAEKYAGNPDKYFWTMLGKAENLLSR